MRVHDTLWLDTTMMVADYFQGLFDDDGWAPFVRACPERVLYGSDAPNLPYAWDREVRALARALPDVELQAVLGGNASALFG